MARRGICTLDDCGKPHVAFGLCRKHYARQYYNGDQLLRRRANGSGLAFVKTAIAAQTDDCILWPYGKYPSGYGKVYDRTIKKSVGTHQFVCRLAHGEPSAGMEVRHACHKKACINPRHLSWSTHRANMDDNIRDGRILAGQALPQAKLTEHAVIAIRSSNESQRVLAERYGVSQGTISLIKLGKNWKHIKAEAA